MQKISLSKFLSYWDNSELHGTQGAKGFSVKFLILLLYLKKCNSIQVRPRGGWIKTVHPHFPQTNLESQQALNLKNKFLHFTPKICVFTSKPNPLKEFKGGNNPTPQVNFYSGLERNFSHIQILYPPKIEILGVLSIIINV